MALPNALGAVERPVRAAARGAGAAAGRVDRILRSFETLGVAIASIEREMRGMRGDLREVIAALGALREDVGVLDGSVSGIRDATVSLEQQVAGLEDHLLTVGKSLRRIDSLVPRISRRSRL